MATLKTRGKQWTVERRVLFFQDAGEAGSGFSFPCDEYGHVEWQQMPLPARDAHHQLTRGAGGLTLTVYREGQPAERRFLAPVIQRWQDQRRDADVYYCPGGCGGEVEVWSAGDMGYCDACLRRLEREYPQGWRYYPGDVCEHGCYVGGCGVDWMCGACEGGS